MKKQEFNLDNAKKNIAQNLILLRKQAELTQQDLAQKLNYSDKTISKWERGDGIPDVLVLATLANFYGVTVDDFLKAHTRPPKSKKTLKNLFAKRWLISMLSAGLVWLVATIVTVLWMFVDNSVPVAKYAFVVAGPVFCIVLLVFSCIWGKLWQRCVMASLLDWSLCVMINVVLPISQSWLVYIVGAVVQLLVILWYLLRFFVTKDKHRRDKKIVLGGQPNDENVL